QNYEIYVSDAGNFDKPPWQIVKFDQNGENPVVFIDDHLAWPQDIVFLEADNVVLISNLNTGQIAKFDATSGEYLGDFATGIGGPTRMKIGQDGLLYVLQWESNGPVLRYQLDGTFVDAFTDTGVNTSIGLDWDSDGNLYVSSYGTSTVHQFNSDGEHQGVFISANLQGPTNIWFGENGHLFVLNWSGTTIREFDAEGNFIGNFITGLGQPEGVAFLENGDILIGNGIDASVKQFDSAGNFVKDLVAPGSAGLLQPNAVVLRDVLPSTITEVSRAESFIAPTQGRQFFLEGKWQGQLDSIFVYSISGKRVFQTTSVEEMVWDAAGLSPGTYIVVGMTAGQQRLSQKIMVQD
ncbi:MAG: T9SS type A sorting domain-containing protein, partial [Phaeodactylibacter sp.]|nr:T9SS type A sorting domain-containing protein [Phaeodactylibacter sp.]